MLYENIYDLIGNTPLLKINKFNNNLYCKLEKQNITGSIKDRAAKEIIENLVKNNIVKQNDLIICSTSGNLGISLAFMCKRYNLRLIIIMPKNVSSERIKLIKSLSARIYLVNNHGFDYLTNIGKLLSKKLGGYYIDQFNNEFNVLAGYKLGFEISKDLEKIDYIICGIGSGGTYQGLKKYFKNDFTKIIGILPFEKNHQITGIGPGFIPKNIERLENIIFVNTKDALKNQNDFINEEGILIGKSSGAILCGCKELISKNNLENKNIIVIFPDSKERYLSE